MSDIKQWTTAFSEKRDSHYALAQRLMDYDFF